jgi:Domain of unknown function (DUF1854).
MKLMPQLNSNAAGQLLLRSQRGSILVRPIACFPWSEPSNYISLRNEAGVEVGFIHSVAELDHSSRTALEITLRQTRFVFEVTGIEAVEDEFELRTWSVKTRQGPRSFQTKLDEWPRTLENGGVVIRDLSGDLYQIKDPTALDRASQKLVWAFME